MCRLLMHIRVFFDITLGGLWLLHLFTILVAFRKTFVVFIYVYHVIIYQLGYEEIASHVMLDMADYPLGEYMG